MSVTGVWLPEFRGHQFALPAPPPGIAFVREDDQWPGDQWALRIERTGGAVDWSASYFRGIDTSPDLGIAVRGGGLPGIRVSHHRVRVAGADMAANAGRFGLRAEGAYVETEDPHGRDPFVKNPFVFAVAGADRTFGGRLNLNVQYLFRYVRHQVGTSVSVQDTLNSQTRAVQHGASFRVGYKWLHDTLEAECAAVAYGAPSGTAIRPKLVYALTDSWKVLAGAEILRGETSSCSACWSRTRPDTPSCDGASDRECEPCPGATCGPCWRSRRRQATYSAQPDGRRVALTGTVVAVNQQSDSVTLIDLQRMEAYRHVKVVGGPHEAAASPDGRTVVVTNYNKAGAGPQKTLSLIALPSGDTIKTIDLGEYRAPHDVRWVDATRVVVTSEANQALLVVNVSTARSSGCSAPRPACRTCWRSPPTARVSTARTCATAA